jgi:hypothetical protein
MNGGRDVAMKALTFVKISVYLLKLVVLYKGGGENTLNSQRVYATRTNHENQARGF